MRLRREGWTHEAIADKFGCGEASVRRALARAGYKGLSPLELRYPIELEKPLTVTSLPLAVTADWHIPLTDFDLVERFLDDASLWGAEELVIAGDFWNMDALSTFDFKQENAGLSTEIEAGNELMSRLLTVFRRVYFTWGNHDARLHKALGYKVPFATAMKMLLVHLTDDERSRITFSNLDHLVIDTPRGPYRVAHPKSYSRLPLRNPLELAAKYHCHVITGHSHHSAVGHDRSGKFVIAEIGGFFDVNKTGYLQRSTTYPEWQQGYGFIDSDGGLHITGAGWST